MNSTLSFYRRALLGITMQKENHLIKIPALAGAQLACVRPGPAGPLEHELSPLQVWNLKYEQVIYIF